MSQPVNLCFIHAYKLNLKNVKVHKMYKIYKTDTVNNFAVF